MFCRKQLASVFDWMPQEQKKVSKCNAMQRIGRSENKYVMIFPEIFEKFALFTSVAHSCLFFDRR